MRLKSITVASSSYLTVPKNTFHLELNLYVVRQENVNVINCLYSLDLEYPLQNKKTKKKSLICFLKLSIRVKNSLQD